MDDKSNYSCINYRTTANSKQIQELAIELSGAHHMGSAGEPRQEFYKKLKEFIKNEPLRAEIAYPELNFTPNEIDPNCIEVIFRLAGSPRDGYSIGYIPRTMNRTLLDWVSNYSPRHYKNLLKCKTQLQIHECVKDDGVDYRAVLFIDVKEFKGELFPIPSRIAFL